MTAQGIDLVAHITSPKMDCVDGWGSLCATPAESCLALLYPPRCAGCRRMGELSAPRVKRASNHPQRRLPPMWPAGHRRHACPSCLATPLSSNRIAAAAIVASPLREAIHRLKYENDGVLAAPGRANREALAADRVASGYYRTGAARSRQGGYNQSALLADALGQAVGVPVSGRASDSPHRDAPTVGLGHGPTRRTSQALTCHGDTTNERIVLIDDVCPQEARWRPAPKRCAPQPHFGMGVHAGGVRWDPTCPPRRADTPAPL